MRKGGVVPGIWKGEVQFPEGAQCVAEGRARPWLPNENGEKSGHWDERKMKSKLEDLALGREREKP